MLLAKKDIKRNIALRDQFQLLILACFSSTTSSCFFDNSEILVYQNNKKEFYCVYLFTLQGRVSF